MMLCTEIAHHEQEQHYSLWQNLNFICGISEIKPASSGLYWCYSFCFLCILYRIPPIWKQYIQMSSKMTDHRDVLSTRDTESGWKSLQISVLESVGMKLSWWGGWEFYENLIMSHTLVDQMNSDWEQKHRWILRKALLNIRFIYFIL